MVIDEEIVYVYIEEYINVVKCVGEGKLEKLIVMFYGFGIEDILMFLNMYEVSVLFVGGILIVVDVVFFGKVKYVFNLGGGLYYGFCGKVFGFCIYNDSFIVMKYI